MAHPLDGIDAKLEHAIVRLNELHQEDDRFVRLRPFSVRQEDYGEDGIPWLRLVASDRHVGEPSVTLSLLAGEILHQLRSALDHLIHQLVIANGQSALLAASRTHQFPVFDTPQRYAKRGKPKIVGVSTQAAALIEAVQPYHTATGQPHYDPLWLLQDLDNTAKHRLIPVVVAALDILRAQDSYDDITYADLFTVQGFGPLHDGDVLVTMPKPDRFVLGDLHCAVAFVGVGQLGYESVTMLANRLVCYVSELVNRFRSTCFLNEPQE